MFDNLKIIPKILTEPGEFFSKLGEQPIGELYKFWIQLSLVNSVIGFLLSLLNISGWTQVLEKLTAIIGPISPLISVSGVFLFNVIFSISLFIFMITFGFIFMIIFSLFMHIFVYLFGGRGFGKTLTVFVIASTPTMVLSSIPIVPIFASLYSLILQIVGLSKLHKFSTLKSVLVTFVPVLLIVLIIGVSVFIFLSSLIIGPK